MNQTSFIIRKSKLLNELKNIAKALGRISRANMKIVIELTVTDGLLTIVIPGAKFKLECETKSTAKATMGFFYFKDIIQTSKDLKIEVIINDNAIKIGLASYNAQTTFFENDSILRSIKLPINYTHYHLLQLDNKGYTIEELRFNNLEFEVYYAKKALKDNIFQAKELLSVYGVKTIELEEIINKKIEL